MTNDSFAEGSLLTEVGQFLQREWPYSSIEDGYYVIVMRAPFELRCRTRPAGNIFDEINGRKELFSLTFKDAKRLWLISLNLERGLMSACVPVRELCGVDHAVMGSVHEGGSRDR